MARKQFELPDLGEGIAEGELVSWLVAEGDDVNADQTIAEVETDKAVVEVPSPYDGTVAELHYDEGDVMEVDSVIATFDVPDADGAESADSGADETGDEVEQATERVSGDGADAGESASPETTTSGDEVVQPADERVFASPSTRTLARELGVDLSTVSGSGQGGRVTPEDVRRAAGASNSEPAEGAAEPADAGASTPSESNGGSASPASGESTSPGAGQAQSSSTSGQAAVPQGGAGRDRTLAMPATRQLARDLGVNIDDVPASEQRHGEAFVTPEDVQRYVETGGSEAAAGAGAAGAGGGSTGAGSTQTGESAGERVPYTGIRKTIGEQMARSKYTAPHVSHHDEFDATDLVAVREDLSAAAEREGVNLTYLPFVVKAVTRALQEFPYLNSSLDEDAGEIVLHDEYNIGIAVATDHGLMVPVVEHADQKGLVELAAEIDDLATRARNRELAREEMQGGTFTITNIGVIGGEFSSPIINHPEAAILAMGPIDKRPWVVDDEVVARETMRLSISVDHRLVDGAEAAQFTNRVQELLGRPARLLL
ncbi:MAG: 2-oxo acid dehydrogenase subunit E2 [Halobacterium sp.]